MSGMPGFIKVTTIGDDTERCLNVKFIAEFSELPDGAVDGVETGSSISLDFGVGWRMFVTDTYPELLRKVRAATGSIH